MPVIKLRATTRTLEVPRSPFTVIGWFAGVFGTSMLDEILLSRKSLRTVSIAALDEAWEGRPAMTLHMCCVGGQTIE